MGYLDIASSSMADFKKAVISLWFRVPAATLNTVLALSDSPSLLQQGNFNIYPALHKIIPLITFGSVTETTFGDIGSFSPLSPCFVGIDCVSPFFDPTLAVNLQMPASVTYDIAANPGANPRHAAFFMSGRSSFANPPAQVLKVTPDTWHHILISFDLSTSCSCYYATDDEVTAGSPTLQVSAGPTFTWAFDNVSKVGLSMQPSGGALWNETTNAVPVSEASIFPDGLFYGAAADLGSTATWATTSIPSNAKPIGIPSSAVFVDNIYNVEMAELQVWTGVTCDASNAVVRAAFVTAAGKPVITYSIPDNLLGASPQIRMHRGTDWIAGVNVGSIGDFTKSGTVNDFTPGPSL